MIKYAIYVLAVVVVSMLEYVCDYVTIGLSLSVILYSHTSWNREHNVFCFHVRFLLLVLISIMNAQK